jgi:hypothetical protein
LGRVVVARHRCPAVTGAGAEAGHHDHEQEQDDEDGRGGEPERDPAGGVPVATVVRVLVVGRVVVVMRVVHGERGDPGPAEPACDTAENTCETPQT